VLLRIKIVFFLFFFLFYSTLNANPIDFSKNNETLLEKAEIYIDTKDQNFLQIKKSAVFTRIHQKHINLGFVRDTTLWIRLEFFNSSAKEVKKILEVKNPLLEEVVLYTDGTQIEKGSLNVGSRKNTRNTIFHLHLDTNENKVYFIKVKNATTALRLGLSLKEKFQFLDDEYYQQLLVYIFFTIVTMLFIYNISLFVYTRENTYGYYCLYLGTLMFQQATYLGITQMYMPQWFIDYDNLGVLFKVNIMYITAALFAKSFLQTKKYPKLDKIYNTIIIISILEIPIFGTPYFYYPEVGILTALFFIIYNMYAGYYIYKQGYKQARLFVIGWSFLVVGFLLMILDGLGLISVMQNIFNLIMFLIAVEAMVLSLAFVDRYVILRAEKQMADALLVDEYKNRQAVIEEQIKEQTISLSKALETKQTLLKELHHRTKNNLQLISSLVRMQADSSSKELKEKLNDLDRRINAISKTHQMLYLKDDLERIDMHQYISELYNDLVMTCNKKIEAKIDVKNLFIHLREASYIGLIVNELITNSIKYVEKEKIEIYIGMYNEGDRYFLTLGDNATIKQSDLKTDGLGIKLVKTLVEHQLEGKVKIKVEDGLKYMIEFEL
jgi:two-component system, sensor histidine kinase LadS